MSAFINRNFNILYELDVRRLFETFKNMFQEDNIFNCIPTTYHINYSSAMRIVRVKNLVSYFQNVWNLSTYI